MLRGPSPVAEGLVGDDLLGCGPFDKGAEEVTIGGLWGAEEVVDKVEVIDDASEETPQRVGAVSAGHPGLGLGGKERVKKGSSLVNVSDGCFL